MGKYKSIVVVGSSGTGKTTLVNGLRTPELAGEIVIPERYITRPERQNDDSGENTHVDLAAFQGGVKDGLIAPYWQRELDGGRIEQYGFAVVDEADDRLRIYSANNAFLRDRNPSVEHVLETGLVVMATAEREAREARLADRSPDMLPEERSIRLGDNGADILHGVVPLELIDTSDLSPAEGQLALRGIVDSITG